MCIRDRNGTGGDIIVGFLENYREHHAARTVKTVKLKEYIQKQLTKGGLRNWTILLSGGGENEVAMLGAHASVKRSKREWNEKGTTREDLKAADHFRIKVLTQPSDELVGVSKEVWNEALEKDIADWEGQHSNFLNQGV